LKFYWYVSEEKVDMLLPQVPLTEKQKASSKIGFNLGILKGEIAKERLSLDDKINRVKVVSNYISLIRAAGDIDSEKSWIKGTMSAFIGHFPSAKSAVFFIGNINNVNLVLGGSTANLVSKANSEDVGYGQSYLPTLIDNMHSCITSGEFMNSDTNELTKRLTSGVGHPESPSPWFELIDKLQGFKKEPLVEIEFLAKILVKKDQGGHKSILATPLYISTD